MSPLRTPRNGASAGARILLTGGAGFIGSHVAVELMAAGHEVIILDNFENSDPSTIERIGEIAGVTPPLEECDVRDESTLERVLKLHAPHAVVHLAGKKAVGESVADPLLYFHDNIYGAIALLEAMRASNVDRLVFSSSATVYGTTDRVPIAEDAPTEAANPYGRTKLVIEQFIDDVAASAPEFDAISLRYFNPVGAHESHLIGESPRGVPGNLFPFVAQTAAGLRTAVQVFGADYPTPDGTGVRDYIHVCDLARGHVHAIEDLLGERGDRRRNHRRFNLGTGRGHSVLEVIRAFGAAAGRPVPFEIAERRPGDAARSLADPGRAERELGWSARYDLARMCDDHWAFQCRALSPTLALPAAVPTASAGPIGPSGGG